MVPVRSESRYRLYEPADLDKLARVLRMRSLGFSLTVDHRDAAAACRRTAPTAAGRGCPNASLQASCRRRWPSSSARSMPASRRSAANSRRPPRCTRNCGATIDYVERRLAGEPLEAALEERRAGSRAMSPPAGDGTSSAAPAMASPRPMPWVIGLVTAHRLLRQRAVRLLRELHRGRRQRLGRRTGLGLERLRAGRGARHPAAARLGRARRLPALPGHLHVRLRCRRRRRGAAATTRCSSCWRERCQGYFVGPMLGACRILIQIGIPAAAPGQGAQGASWC